MNSTDDTRARPQMRAVVSGAMATTRSISKAFMSALAVKTVWVIGATHHDGGLASSLNS